MTNTACSGYSHAASAEPLPSGNIRKIALWQRSGSWALRLKGQTATQKCISTQQDSGEELRDAPPDLRFFFFLHNFKPNERQRTGCSQTRCVTNCSLSFPADFSSSTCTTGTATHTKRKLSQGQKAARRVLGSETQRLLFRGREQ